MRPICILLGAAVLLGGGIPLRAELVNGIKAVVHDSVITVEDVEALNAQTEDTLRRQYYTQPQEFSRHMQKAEADNLDKLLRTELILHEFGSAGYKFPESLIDDAVKDEIKNRFGDRVTATKTLQARGITYEKFRQQIRDQIIVRAMREKNVSQSIIISPHKVEVYYLAHRDDFKVEDEVKLRMIVLNKPPGSDSASISKLADEILGKLNEGASFEEMAKVYSQGSQREQGGSWDWVEKSVLRKELASVAFSLKPGQHSGVIDTPEASYIMLVEDSRPAHCKPLLDVRDQIEKNLVLAEQKRLEEQWIERLKKKTFHKEF